MREPRRPRTNPRRKFDRPAPGCRFRVRRASRAGFGPASWPGMPVAPPGEPVQAVSGPPGAVTYLDPVEGRQRLVNRPFRRRVQRRARFRTPAARRLGRTRASGLASRSGRTPNQPRPHDLGRRRRQARGRHGARLHERQQSLRRQRKVSNRAPGEPRVSVDKGGQPQVTPRLRVRPA
jgi:hypothetical protein